MRKIYPFLTAAIALLLATLACNFPGVQEMAAGPEIAEPGDAILPIDADTGPAEPQAQPPPPTETPTPTPTPTITETPTITPTFTPEIPIAWVTRNTNCRSGPGTEYDIVYIFLVGDEAEIVALSSVPNYVIVEVPDGSGRTCWLWMQYGEQSGSTEGLPERTPPPTPTPSPTPTPELNFKFDFDTVLTCAGLDWIFLRVTNTGAVTIESRHLSAKNQDTLESDSNSMNVFPVGAGCTPWPDTAISPGDTRYVIAKFTSPVTGDSVDFTIKACAVDDLGEPCRVKSDTLTIPFPSDENAKENFEPIDSAEILAKVSDLPITAWNYKDTEREGRHIGPMAQDFNERFGVGEYEEYISAVDTSGVALAAIQALSDIAEKQERRIAVLEEQNKLLTSQNEALSNRLVALETQDLVPARIVWAVLAGLVILAGVWCGMRVTRWFRFGSDEPG